MMRGIISEVASPCGSKKNNPLAFSMSCMAKLTISQLLPILGLPRIYNPFRRSMSPSCRSLLLSFFPRITCIANGRSSWDGRQGGCEEGRGRKLRCAWRSVRIGWGARVSRSDRGAYRQTCERERAPIRKCCGESADGFCTDDRGPYFFTGKCSTFTSFYVPSCLTR